MKIRDEWATVRAVLDGRKSLARYGDTELKLTQGRHGVTQMASADIGKRLRRILKIPNPNVLVGVPRIVPDIPPLASKGFWEQYIPLMRGICDRVNTTWFSAFVSRRDAWPIPREAEYWTTWRQVWADRPVLLLSGSKKGFSTRRLLNTAASVDVIETPRRDAWSAYTGMLADCRAWAAAKRDPLVVAACGAAATVLCHELGCEGIQALDMGHAAQAYSRVSPKELDEP